MDAVSAGPEEGVLKRGMGRFLAARVVDLISTYLYPVLRTDYLWYSVHTYRDNSHAEAEMLCLARGDHQP